MTDAQIDDARSELECALRFGEIKDAITREHVEKAHVILRDWCRAGNLSPAYQLRQDQERRGVS